MLPYKSIISINKTTRVAVYLQISNAIIINIKKGVIRPDAKLPGTRVMAALLGVHRKTIVAAYEELESQGWIYIKKSKGTFVTNKIPELNPKVLVSGTFPSPKEEAGFDLRRNTFLLNVNEPHF